MTTAPAMPELPKPAHRGPSGTGTYFDSFTADQMRAYALATLQAQPAEVSDAAVWELWLRVCAESDNLSTRVMIANFARAILAMRPQADPLNPGWCIGCVPENCIGCGIGLNEPRRAILRPQAVPMTEEQRRTLVGNYFADAWAKRAAHLLLSDYDKHHRITAPAGGEG